MTSFTSFFFFQIMGPYDLSAVQSQKAAIRLRHCTTACARCPQAFEVEMLLINVLVVVFGLWASFATFCEWGEAISCTCWWFWNYVLSWVYAQCKYSLLVVVCKWKLSTVHISDIWGSMLFNKFLWFMQGGGMNFGGNSFRSLAMVVQQSKEGKETNCCHSSLGEVTIVS